MECNFSLFNISESYTTLIYHKLTLYQHFKHMYIQWTLGSTRNACSDLHFNSQRQKKVNLLAIKGLSFFIIALKIYIQRDSIELKGKKFLIAKKACQQLIKNTQ